MRKKSHILLAGYLADQMKAADSLQLHRKAFCLGSILPDCKPSFLTTRHEYFGTHELVQERIRFLVEEGSEICSARVFWRRIGEVIHYIADYFTFPHNKTFTGNLREHNHYEKDLKDRLKICIENGEAAAFLQKEKVIHFKSLQELFSYVQVRHENYLQKARTIAEDIRYILSVCMQVVRGMFELCMANDALSFAVA